MTTFYSNYVRLCAEKGKSASGVAREIGLSNAAANGWKNGKEPSDVTLQKLSVYFDVPVSELTEEKAPTQAGEREITMDDFTYAMHNESGDLTDDDKEWLLSMARRIAEDNRKRNQNPD